MLAWFLLSAPDAAPLFQATVEASGAAFEGWGVDKRNGAVEGYAIFKTRKDLDTFARKHRTMYEFIESVK
jgi:hypothetical protein